MSSAADDSLQTALPLDAIPFGQNRGLSLLSGKVHSDPCFGTKDFFNNLVMSRIKGSDSDPSIWMKRLVQLGGESDAASRKIAKELNS